MKKSGAKAVYITLREVDEHHHGVTLHFEHGDIGGDARLKQALAQPLYKQAPVSELELTFANDLNFFADTYAFKNAVSNTTVVSGELKSVLANNNTETESSANEQLMECGEQATINEILEEEPDSL